MTSLILAPALAMAASVFGTPVPELPETQLVTYADLNLQSPHGRTKLEQRVRSAADRLCRDDVRASPEGGYLNEKCFRTAMAEGARQIQVAILSSEKGLARAGSGIKLSRR